MPYNIQGNTVHLNAEPLLRNDKHYVPLRDLVHALGGTVAFDNDTKTVQAAIGQWTASVQVGSRSVDVSGTPVTLSADPYVEDGQMFVPFDFFRDAFGYSVSIASDDAGDPVMNITNPNAA